jgi:hypothetical protein
MGRLFSLAAGPRRCGRGPGGSCFSSLVVSSFNGRCSSPADSAELATNDSDDEKNVVEEGRKERHHLDQQRSTLSSWKLETEGQSCLASSKPRRPPPSSLGAGVVRSQLNHRRVGWDALCLPPPSLDERQRRRRGKVPSCRPSILLLPRHVRSSREDGLLLVSLKLSLPPPFLPDEPAFVVLPHRRLNGRVRR